MKFDPCDTELYIGPTKSCFCGYASDENIRKGAASGGFISSFLIFLLEEGLIDGALVSKMKVENGDLKAFPFIARTKEEILSSQSSIYMDFSFPCIKLLKQMEGKFAVVGLPCHLSTIKRIEERNPSFANKIAVKISLFCSHSSSPKLIKSIFRKNGIYLTKVESFRFRQGHWRGYAVVNMKNGDRLTFPYLDFFGLYMNLYLHRLQKCISCTDHFGSNADISCGDAWLRKLKKHPIKHSLIIVRNSRAEQLFRKFIDSGMFIADLIEERVILNSQKRGVITKWFVVGAARNFASIFGFKSAYKGKNIAWPHHYLAAMLMLLNMKISESPLGMRIILKVPRPILYIYTIFIKILINF